MKQIGGWRAAAATMALSVLALAGAANAGRVQIDGPSNSITACTLGGACSATLLQSTSPGLPGPFSFNFGFGTFNSLFIYSNGLVSIGAPIAAGADLSSLSTIGGNVFTPGYAPGRTFSLVTIQGPDTTQIPDPNAGRPVVRVSFCFPGGSPGATCNSDDQTEQFSIYDLGAGRYELKFNYGAFFNDNPPVIPANAYAGYSFNGTTVQQSGTALQANVTSLSDFRYIFPAATGPTVPEPATWAMLIFGFMATGAVMRRQRHGIALTA